MLIFSCTQQNITLQKSFSIPQNHNLIVDNILNHQILISKEEEKFLTNFYNYKFIFPFISTKPEFDRYFVEWGFRKLKRRKYSFINYHNVDKKFIKKIKENANLKTYPNAFIKAITIRNSYLRILPVDIPIFLSKKKFPFDMMINSSIYIGTPLLITHISKDRKWAFVESYIAAGWIEIEDIAFVDNRFIEKWYSKKFVIPIKDRVSVYDNSNFFQFLAFIGSRFPLSKEKENFFIIKIPIKDSNNFAKIKEIKVPKEYFAMAPLKFIYRNCAIIANELTGEPYFWGGFYFFRDCSMTIRDFFSCFNIYLPRNSYDQAHFYELGDYIDISKLSPRKKEKFIIKKGKPYLTLLWFPGHIMLYIGEKNGKALVFHNFWSIKVNHYKRIVVGQSCITPLYSKKRGYPPKTFDFRYKVKGIKYVIPF